MTASTADVPLPGTTDRVPSPQAAKIENQISNVLDRQQSNGTPLPPALPVRLPEVSLSRSRSHAEALAQTYARASSTDALNAIFVTEANPSLFPAASSSTTPPQPITNPALALQTVKSTIDLTSHVAASTLRRLDAKLPHGAFIASCADFATVACWEPMLHPSSLEAQLEVADAEVRGSHPLRGAFLQGLSEHAMREVGAFFAEDEKANACGEEREREYWHLCMLARDPSREYIPGAVRAVVVPVMQKLVSGDGVVLDDGTVVGRFDAATKKTCVWLAASSPRAVGIYEHFGFRVVGIVDVAGGGREEGGNGVRTWCMLHTGEE